MLKFLTIFSITLLFALSSFYVEANHCGGGHKEVKEESNETTDKSKKE